MGIELGIKVPENQVRTTDKVCRRCVYSSQIGAEVKPIWASEIEEFPIAVTKIRFPEDADVRV